MRTRACFLVLIFSIIGSHHSNADGGSSRCRGPWYNPNLIRAVQIELAARGHNPGKIDGHFGPATRSALERWGEKNKHPVSWDLSASTVKILLGSKYDLKDNDILGC